MKVRTIIESIFEAVDKVCPQVTKNLKMNTINRNKAIKADHIQYGPVNLSDDAYYVRLAKHWNSTPEKVKNSSCMNCGAFDISPRMIECMTVGKLEDDDGILGYCWMHDFKCHSARTCYTWTDGGPIKTNATSYTWEDGSKRK